MKLFPIIILICGSSVQALSQTDTSFINENLTESIEAIAEELDASGTDEIPESILFLNEPTNINGKLDRLLLLRLLTDNQITAIYNYRKHFGDFVELQELQLVDGFSKELIKRILPYIRIGNQHIREPSHVITIRGQLQLKKNEEDYLGDRGKISVRYRGMPTPGIGLTFTGEKDAGEKLFNNKQGFDFNSGSLTIWGKSIMQKIILGDFNLEKGQGLTIWTGFGFEQRSSVAALYKSGRGIVPYSGSDENRFFRGAAVSLFRKKIETDFWYSNHRIDGTKKISPDEGEYISSFATSGYHRNENEINQRNAVREIAYGTNVQYNDRDLTLGLSAYRIKYSLPVQSSDEPYKKYGFSGKSSGHAGLHYAYSLGKLFLFGETSLGKRAATINGLLISFDKRVSAGIIWRMYPKEYINIKSNAFGVNTQNNNESGKFLGMNLQLTRAIAISCYADLVSFPFLKYRVDQPSHGYDTGLQLDFTPKRTYKIQLRYRNTMRQQNESSLEAGINALHVFNTKSFHLGIRLKIDNDIHYGVRADYSLQSENGQRRSSSAAISQEFFYRPMGNSFSLNCRYTVFNCPDFNTRIYQYENDVPGSFSIPFYYGSGSRFYVNLNLKLSRALSFSIRYASTWYEDELSPVDEVKAQLKMSIR